MSRVWFGLPNMSGNREAIGVADRSVTGLGAHPKPA